MNRKPLSLLFDLLFAGLMLAGCGSTVTPTPTAALTAPATTLPTPTSIPAPSTTPTLAVTTPISTLVATPAPSGVAVPRNEKLGAPVVVGFFIPGVGDVPTGVLLGGAQQGRWLNPAEVSLRGGETYHLYSAEAYLGTAQGSAPYSQPPHFLSDQLIDLTPAPRAGQEIFAIGGEWNALPRPFQVLPTDIDLYREAVEERLRVNGLVDSEAQVHQTLSVDLDGNGTDEVLIAAAHFASGGVPAVAAGDYSLIILRTVVNNTVVSIPLLENYYLTDEAPAAANLYTVMAILDLNGDGRMEIVVRGERYEGETTVVYEVEGAASQPVLISNGGSYPPAQPVRLPTGVIQWKETIPIPNPSSAPFDDFRGQQLIFHNGYVYIFGGRSASDDRLTDVYFSAIKPDGALVGWMETTSLPGKYYDHVVVKIGAYVYLLTGAAGIDEVYYAPLNADGSIGAWKKTASLSPSRQNFAAVGHGNFIYATGGNSGGNQKYVEYTSVRSDGGLNPWAYTTFLPVAIQAHTMIAYDGYLYVFGGKDRNDEWVTTVYFSAINPDGTLAGWKTTTPLPQKVSGYSTFESNGYIYLLGGDSTTYYTRILENHALDVWQTATALPSMRQGLRVGAHNGFAYAMGGYDFAEYQSTVYYGSIGSRASAENPVVEHPDCTSGWTRLKAGSQAQVSKDSPLPNRVRFGPSASEPQIASLYPGSVLKLIEGPICADGLVFWKVESELIPGGVGWTAEGDGVEYYLVPYAP